MRNNFRIDNHKLMLHVDRVSAWLRGKTICPIYLEIAPSGACNHRCIFCALDYLNYKPEFLDEKVLKSAVKQAGVLGVKSIMYAGEGEPLLHKDICKIISYTKGRGIDVAVTTNGVLLKRGLSKEILKFLSWVRVSLNAGRGSTYSKIHNSGKNDFNKVLQNLEDAVKIKAKYKLAVIIGAQLLLLKENIKEVVILAKLLKGMGVDYLTIKPYSRHPLSLARIKPVSEYKNYAYINAKLNKIQTDKFKIIFRSQTMRRLDVAKDYRHCLGLPFWAYISACGDVYACSTFLGKKEFSCGNIYRSCFKAVINGRRRREIIRKAALKLDMSGCREACRLDKINSYLWELKNPGPHVNFI